MKPYHVVITTIGNGAIIKALSDNLEAHGHLDDTTVWVIADHKTPVECYTACLNTRADVQAITPQYQEDWGRRFPLLYGRIPWNSDSRRNIGYLMALEAGCEWLILLDDDNFPEDDDLIGMHTVESAPLIDTTAAWYNYFINLECCDIFPRGYPYTGRVNTDVQRLTNHHAQVGVNIGLWRGDPDIDAMTALVWPTQLEGLMIEDKAALPSGTWTPINSQNTAIRRELIPAAMFAIQPSTFNRYGDIFAGYFLQAVMQNTDYHVSFGRPMVHHKRNPHDLLKDLKQEYEAILLLEWMLPRSREYRLWESSPVENVHALADWLKTLDMDWLPWIGDTLDKWADACEVIGL